MAHSRRRLSASPAWIRFRNKITAIDSTDSDLFMLFPILSFTILFRKNILKKVGLLDEVFSFYFEDADFCERVRKKGKKIINVPKAISYHKVSTSLGEQSPRTIYFLRRGRIRFIIKHYPVARMIPSLLWWVVIQPTIEAMMIVSVIRNYFLDSRLEFIANRGTKDHLLAIIEAIVWNIKNLRATLKARKMLD